MVLARSVAEAERHAAPEVPDAGDGVENGPRQAGIRLFKAGQLPEAVAAFTEALSDPELGGKDRATVLANRSAVHAAMLAWDLALADADAAVTLQPSNLKCLFRRAEAHSGSGHYKVGGFTRALFLWFILFLLCVCNSWRARTMCAS